MFGAPREVSSSSSVLSARSAAKRHFDCRNSSTAAVQTPNWAASELANQSGPVSAFFIRERASCSKFGCKFVVTERNNIFLNPNLMTQNCISQGSHVTRRMPAPARKPRRKPGPASEGDAD
eukprot:scaffold31788_cov65-Phaeocystis_antarctica.AAC.2